MSNLPVRSSLGQMVPSRLERQAAQQMGLARLESMVLTMRGEAYVDSHSAVTVRAIEATGEIGMAEIMVVSRTPHVEGRARYIADSATQALAGVVRRIGR